MADFEKHASAHLDYHINWQALLTLDGLASATWVVPSGLTATSSGITGTSAYIWLSGGVPGNTYTVSNGVWTQSGRHNWMSFQLGIG